MKSVQSVEEKELRKLTGQPVCVVLRNGMYVVGMVKDVRNGRLYIDGRLDKENEMYVREAKAQITGIGLGIGLLGGGLGLGLGMLSTVYSLRALGGFGGFPFFF